MTEPPHRKRFQIHLSTAIVLMFVAGGLIWANVVPDVSPFGTWEGHATTFGWPLKSYLFSHVHIPDRLYGFEILIDLIIAPAILYATWHGCEWLIRRRAARKGVQEMTEPPRRKRFQIHLSTAFIMMITAGGIIGLNMTERGIVLRGQDHETRYFGWPFPAWKKKEPEVVKEPGPQLPPTLINHHETPGLGAPADISIAVGLLVGIFFMSEWLIRRRAARKGA